MPVSFLLGLNQPVPEPYSWITPTLTPSRIAYIGLRDVDAGEKRLLRQHGIAAFSMHEVDKHGIGRVVDLALDAVNPTRERPVHLSFDVDALDPSVAPSTGTPVRGGLTFREGHYICEAIHETGLLVAFDIMEVNPSLADPESAKATVAIGCSLVRSALGALYFIIIILPIHLLKYSELTMYYRGNAPMTQQDKDKGRMWHLDRCGIGVDIICR